MTHRLSRRYYTCNQLELNDPVGRIEFAHHLYNLLGIELDEDQDQDTKRTIFELDSRIWDRRLKSMYTDVST